MGAGIAVAALALIGGFVNAWSLDWTGLLLMVAGLAAAGAAYLTASGTALPSIGAGAKGHRARRRDVRPRDGRPVHRGEGVRPR